MMTITHMGNDTIYVSFPIDNRRRAMNMSDDVAKWFNDNNIDAWNNRGMKDGVVNGVFLSGADAIAFRLTFCV